MRNIIIENDARLRTYLRDVAAQFKTQKDFKLWIEANQLPGQSKADLFLLGWGFKHVTEEEETSMTFAEAKLLEKERKGQVQKKTTAQHKPTLREQLNESQAEVEFLKTVHAIRDGAYQFSDTEFLNPTDKRVRDAQLQFMGREEALKMFGQNPNKVYGTADVKRFFKDFAKKHHPDLNPDVDPDIMAAANVWKEHFYKEGAHHDKFMASFGDDIDDILDEVS